MAPKRREGEELDPFAEGANERGNIWLPAGMTIPLGTRFQEILTTASGGTIKLPKADISIRLRMLILSFKGLLDAVLDRCVNLRCPRAPFLPSLPSSPPPPPPSVSPSLSVKDGARRKTSPARLMTRTSERKNERASEQQHLCLIDGRKRGERKR